MCALKRIEMLLPMILLMWGCSQNPISQGTTMANEEYSEQQEEQTVGNFQYLLTYSDIKKADPAIAKTGYGKETGAETSREKDVALQHFRLEIAKAGGNGAGIDPKGQTYLGLAAENDFELVSTASRLSPVTYLYESDHGIRPYASLFLTFPAVSKVSGQKLVFRNRLDGNRIVSFDIDSLTNPELTADHN
jgi:hypothetical protein